MRKPRKGMVERFLRHLILSRDFHTSLMLALSVGSVMGEDTKRRVSCSPPRGGWGGGGRLYPPQAS